VSEGENIEQKLKIALDETRMSIMGAQILIGFQFQAVVQESLASLPSSSKLCLAAALILMVCTTGLLMCPAAQHRLIENGEATPRIVAATTRLIELALFALAVGIALDLYIAMERIVGSVLALCSGAAAFVAAVALWYAFPLLTAPRQRQEPAMTSHKPTPLSNKIDYMLTEARRPQRMPSSPGPRSLICCWHRRKPPTCPEVDCAGGWRGGGVRARIKSGAGFFRRIL
jgi:Family of unknown function (DUF6328)